MVLRDDPASTKRLVAYLVPRAAAADPKTALREEVVEDWHSLYEDVYQHADGALDPTFNIAGWNSSFTGLPIPAEQMRSWVAGTVARIAALQPRNVLEIGCGSGLLLFQLAPGCQRYVGIDFSQAALARIHHELGPRGLSQVVLQRGEANQLDRLPQVEFDTVVVNSVVQYFPGLAYLREVLAAAVRAVRSHGILFIGDVRSLPLREAFHSAVQLHQAAPQTAAADHPRQGESRRRQ